MDVKHKRICSLGSICVFLLLVCFVSSSSAAPVFLNPGDPCGFDSDCTYLGTFVGNDHESNVQEILSLLDVFLIGKSDEAGQVDFAFNGSPDNPDGAYFGSWEYLGELLNPVVYMSVKAGNQFALYHYEPSRSSGNWSTENLGVGGPNNDRNIPGLSHLSFFGREGFSVETPEPGSLLLLASGLFGLLAAKRKKA